MATSIPFQRLLHADWSSAPAKRWVAQAVRSAWGWHLDGTRLVGDVAAFLNDLLNASGPVLAGFDFPIGLPRTYGQRTGLGSFAEALAGFGQGDWDQFFLVAERPQEISLKRPFYPRKSSSEAKQVHLLRALGVETIDALRRECERKTPMRRAACSLFWTLGGNQVGKAAISGWQEVVVPALRKGARLWPFEGRLSELAATHLVLAETYPGEAYSHVGVQFRPGMSKRRRDDRQSVSAGLIKWAEERRVSFSPELGTQVASGFGESSSGEDSFDALVGLLGMIEVVDGRRPEAPITQRNRELWEGWILGQA